MSSSFNSQVIAVLRKEFLTEFRTKAGLLTAGLFGLSTVVALALAGQGREISGALAAGLVWVALLFSAVIALPRSFISEEELGTGDMLRLWAKPGAVFWGKSLFNIAIMLSTGLLLGTIYVGMAAVKVVDVPGFILAILGGCCALSGTVTLCGALVAQASHRGMLAGAIALPLLLPLLFLGIAALQAVFGEGNLTSSWTAIAGLWCYAIAGFAIGPVLFEAVWKT
jgi:heme exporter protein B